MKMYAMMLSTTDDMFAEELWTKLSEIVEGTEDRLFFFCGKPLESPFGDERYSNVIFNLMRHFPMDGLIVSSGALSSHVGKRYLELFVQRYGNTKVVSITLPLGNHPYIVLDNYQGTYELTKHLIQEHGYKRFGYLRGPEVNQEVHQRFQGFQGAIKDFGSGDEHVEIARGDFSLQSGKINGALLIKLGVEVIVCDNDEMAHGVYEAAHDLGYRIPEDLAVVGFDDIEQAALLDPPLTTVNQGFSKMARHAFDLLHQKEASLVLMPELKIRTSCGCKMPLTQEELTSIRSRYLSAVDSFRITMSLATEFNHVNSLGDLNEALVSYFKRIGGTEFYLCLYENESQIIKHPSTFVYPEHMIMGFGYNRGEVMENISFQTGDGLPDDVYRKTQSKAFLVYPIGMNDVSFGHILTDTNTAVEMSFSALRAVLSNVLNRIYMYQKLNRYNDQLMDYAYRDSLTKLYNRRGLFNTVEKLYQPLRAGDGKPTVFYCDVNGLKLVNDTYGHATGDDLIIKVGQVLEDYFQDGIVSRVGGDEFVIYVHDISEDEAQRRSEALMTQNDIFLDRQKQVQVSISVGYCVYDENVHHSISDLIDDADKNLYRIKSMHYNMKLF